MIARNFIFCLYYRKRQLLIIENGFRNVLSVCKKEGGGDLYVPPTTAPSFHFWCTFCVFFFLMSVRLVFPLKKKKESNVQSSLLLLGALTGVIAATYCFPSCTGIVIVVIYCLSCLWGLYKVKRKKEHRKKENVRHFVSLNAGHREKNMRSLLPNWCDNMFAFVLFFYCHVFRVLWRLDRPSRLEVAEILG